MKGIEGESLGLFCPGLADELVRREAFEGLEAPGEVVSADEISEMAAEPVVGFVMEALDGSLFDSAVLALDLPIGPEMLGLGEAMIDVVAGAGYLKGVGPERLLPFDHGLDVGRSPAFAGRTGEVGAIVCQDGMDFVGNRLDEVEQEVGGGAPGDHLMLLDEGELEVRSMATRR